jgi:hypothetical protein
MFFEEILARAGKHFVFHGVDVDGFYGDGNFCKNLRMIYSDLKPNQHHRKKSSSIHNQ